MSIRRGGGRGLIGLIGAQSNQFPRAVDLARPFLVADLPVCIGGFHASGCLAMLPEVPLEIREAQALGISIFAGEAEDGRLDRVMQDAWAGKLRPLYNFMSDLPALEGEPGPILPLKHVRRTSGSLSSIDLGRGCPYQCSFCTIVNVQGRKSRFRSADDLEQIIREQHAQGIKRFFITDDNFARNRQWEPLFDRMIKLRVEEGLNIGFTIQVDTQCHRIPNFIEKAGQAGVRRVFIGLENINPDNLLTAKKNQNKITEYRIMLQKWREHGAITYAGYIIGFPADAKESILRDVEIIKRELPLDILEFFVLTPLPGSEDHKALWQKGVWMDPDLNKYDLDHRVSHHSRMSDREWDDAYEAAWRSYYTPEHTRTILRRAAAHPAGRPAQDHVLDDPLVQTDDRVRGRASAGGRRLSPEVPSRPPLWPATGERCCLLHTLPVGDPRQTHPLLGSLTPLQGGPERSLGSAGAADLQRSGYRTARVWRVRKSRSLSRDKRWRGDAGTKAPGRRNSHPCGRSSRGRGRDRSGGADGLTLFYCCRSAACSAVDAFSPYPSNLISRISFEVCPVPGFSAPCTSSLAHFAQARPQDRKFSRRSASAL